jgi:hypothetical protein
VRNTFAMPTTTTSSTPVEPSAISMEKPFRDVRSGESMMCIRDLIIFKKSLTDRRLDMELAI